jgi:hypothetical protein
VGTTDSGQRTVRATAEHRPTERPTLRLHAGEEVTVGRRDDEWPAFVWCTTGAGEEGWVPERYLAREAPEFDRASLLHDYELGRRLLSDDEGRR